MHWNYKWSRKKDIIAVGNPDIDKYNYLHPNNPKARDKY